MTNEELFEKAYSNSGSIIESEVIKLTAILLEAMLEKVENDMSRTKDKIDKFPKVTDENGAEYSVLLTLRNDDLMIMNVIKKIIKYHKKLLKSKRKEELAKNINLDEKEKPIRLTALQKEYRDRLERVSSTVLSGLVAHSPDNYSYAKSINIAKALMENIDAEIMKKYKL